MHTGRARIVTGLRKPRLTRAGTDFAGTVEAVGKNVTEFKRGDEVFGAKTGAFAEYVCVREDRAIVLKPANVTFEEAGSVPVAAITALQGLRDKGKLQAGQKVLVNGASGGVGTFAVQIAKAYGAEVTGVCSGRNVDLVKSIGADHVIDYTKGDFTKTNQRYDLIYDLVCNHSFSERRQILNPNGICVMAGVGGSGWHDGILGRMAGELYAYGRSRFTSQKFDLSRYVEQKRHDRAGRTDAIWKSETGHRPDLQIKRPRGGGTISSGRTRSRESRGHGGMILTAPRNKTA